jgi:hypothetical protein
VVKVSRHWPVQSTGGAIIVPAGQTREPAGTPREPAGNIEYQYGQTVSVCIMHVDTLLFQTVSVHHMNFEYVIMTTLYPHNVNSGGYKVKNFSLAPLTKFLPPAPGVIQLVNCYQY